MNHKHRWQFVEFNTLFGKSVAMSNGELAYKILGDEAKFICECGKIKLVRVKK
jgi:hypothetical protein